jgi:hypothetical protein
MRNINQYVHACVLIAATALPLTSGLCECVLLAIPAAAARVRGPGAFTLKTDAARAYAGLRQTWHIAQYVPKICPVCVLLRDYNNAVPMATHERWLRAFCTGGWCWAHGAGGAGAPSVRMAPNLEVDLGLHIQETYLKRTYARRDSLKLATPQKLPGLNSKGTQPLRYYGS